jgi:myosin heavy subunit
MLRGNVLSDTQARRGEFAGFRGPGMKLVSSIFGGRKDAATSETIADIDELDISSRHYSAQSDASSESAALDEVDESIADAIQSDLDLQADSMLGDEDLSHDLSDDVSLVEEISAEIAAESGNGSHVRHHEREDDDFSAARGADHGYHTSITNNLVKVRPERSTEMELISGRLSEFNGFNALNSDLTHQLSTVSDAISQSQRSFSAMQEFVRGFENDIYRAGQIEADRDELMSENIALKNELDKVSSRHAARVSESEMLQDRNKQLRAQLDARKSAQTELENRLERMAKELGDSRDAHDEISSDNQRLSNAHDRITSEKETLAEAKSELQDRYGKLRQTESELRGQILEFKLQNEKLNKVHGALVSDHEKLRNELRLTQREHSEAQNKFVLLEDETKQLQIENETLKSRSAADSYALRNELDMQKSTLRVSERALAEANARIKDLQRDLIDSENAQRGSTDRLSALQSEFEQEKKELSNANFKLSDVNLKYMSDLLSLDQQREQNKLFQHNVEVLIAENRRLAKFESLYQASENQIKDLKGKLNLFAETFKNDAAVQRLRQSFAEGEEDEKARKPKIKTETADKLEAELGLGSKH